VLDRQFNRFVSGDASLGTCRNGPFCPVGTRVWFGCVVVRIRVILSGLVCSGCVRCVCINLVSCCREYPSGSSLVSGHGIWFLAMI
jgi:hypothetical protein